MQLDKIKSCILKTLFAVTLLFASCDNSITMFEPPQEAVQQITRSVKKDINIINNARNTVLHVNNCTIVDGPVVSSSPITVEYGDTITYNNVEIINDCNTAIIEGKITSGDFIIYEGPMYAQMEDYTLELSPNGPWYDLNENKILNSIEFNVNVNEWK